MSARTICIASAKGGSGKTSLTATFGAFLSELGLNVLLIDGDFATSGLTLLFRKEVETAADLVHSKARSPAGFSEALVEPVTCDEVELAEGLFLIPASYRLLPVRVQSTEITRQRLASLLQGLRNQFDFIFIDAPTGAAEMAQIAMSRKVTDEVVIVSEYDSISAAGVERLRAQLREDLTSNRSWILLNKIHPETKSFAHFGAAAKFLSPIPWDAQVGTAYGRRKLAIDSEAKNDHTLSVLRALKTLCGERIQKHLEAWVDSRVAVIRQPLEEQYADAEKEMALLLSHRSRLERRAEIGRWFGLFVAVAGMIGLAWFVYSAEQSARPLEEFAAFLAVTSVVAIFGLLRLFGGQSRKAQLESARLDKRLGLLNERLKRIELLRPLDAPFGKQPEAAL